MQTLRETIEAYQQKGQALGHFNISDSNQLHAVALAAQEVGLPVVVGLSEGERDFFPLSHVRALVDIYNKNGLQMYLNADHTYSVEKVQKAIADGVDSVVVDGAKLSFDDNLSLLKASVAAAKASGREVLVEGELGYIGTSSNVMESLPEGAAITEELMTKADELKKLVEGSGVDLVAPAVGNIHGIITSGQPKLSIARIAELAQAVGASPERSWGVPLVLHGGSGSPDEEFTAAIKAGITMVHINTDIRVIYRDELKKALAEGKEVAPYKFLAPAIAAMRAYVAQKILLFAGQVNP